MDKLKLFENKVFRSATTLGMLGALGLTLSGCSESQFKDGEATVIQHTYDDRDLISVKPVLYDEEHFILYLEQCGYDESVKEIDANGCKTFPFEVSERIYENTSDSDTVRLRTTTDGKVIFETIE